ncbi:hypothetical protein [Leptospira interrogans]|uniref:hypothetical protein n=1 Tax=Leptospira interrogans TaxID=173 RepID=UPI0009E55263|nr:hypothetical protein [Leptospira interrogans]
MKPESIVIHFDKIEEKFAVLERAKRAEELARSLSECLASRGTNLVTNYWTHFYAAFTSNCTGLTKSNDE